MTCTRKDKIMKRLTKAGVLMLAFLFFPVLLFALPEGETVVEGTATFDCSTANTLKINTTSDKLIVNYNSFSIANNESVYFYQPSTTSAALNRVTGSSLSNIFGSLIANGMFFLINLNGINIGPQANINASAFIASTLNIANPDFIAGNYNFQKLLDKVGKPVINQGYIKVREGGQVALLGSAVANSGTIEATLGSVALAAGEQITLNLDSAGMISVAINEPVKEVIYGFGGEKLDSAVQNSGTILAPGGKVILTAKVLNNVFDNAVNNTAVIQAQSLVNHDGIVELVGEGAPVVNAGTIEAGEVKVAVKDAGFINKGQIIASGREDVPTSGNIYLDATNVVIYDTALLSAKTLIRINVLDAVKTASYVQTDTSTVQSGQPQTTSPGIIIQASQVRITAKEFGSISAPLNINANYIYLYKTMGNINILESVGIGTSNLIRAPPYGFGAIIYNLSVKNLTLEAENGSIEVSKGVFVFSNGILSLKASQNIISYGSLIATDKIELLAGGNIVSLGELKAPYLSEKGATFTIGGLYYVGKATVQNADNAITLNTGNYSGETDDIADIIVNNNAVITLIGDTIFHADFDQNGTGAFTMNTGSSIVGGGFNLTIYASQASTLRAISGVGILTINQSQTGSNPTYTMNNALTLTDLTVNSGVTLNASTLLLTIGGNLKVNGTISGSGGITMNGTGKTLDGTGSITNTGTFTLSTGAKSFNSTANLAFSGTIAISGAITITNNGVVTTTAAGGITGSVAGSTWVNAANSTLTISGPLLATGTLTASASGNTVNYAGGAQTVEATATYYNLTLSGSGAKTLTTTTTTISGNLTLSGTATTTTVVALAINGNLTIGSGTTFTVPGFNITVSGTTSITGTLTFSNATGTKSFVDIIINNGGLISFTKTTSITVNGNLEVDGTGTITGTQGTWLFQKTGGGGTLSGTAASTTLTNATFTTSYANSGTFVITTTLTVTGTTLTNSGTITATTITGTGTFAQGVNGALNFGGASIGVATLDASATGNTVNYNRGNTQTIDSATYYNLILSVSGTKTAGGALTVNGDFTTSGTVVFAYGVFTNNFAGNWIINSTAAAPITATAGSTINFNTPGTPAATSISGTTTATIPFVNINVNNTSGFSINENMSASGTFTVASGVVFTPGAANIISGAGTLTGNGTVQVTRTAATANFTSQYTITNKTLTNLTVDYAAAGQVLSNLTYGNLKVSGSITGASNSATVGGVFTVTGTFTPTSGTLTFNNGASIVNSGTLTFANITIANSATATTASSFSIAGALIVGTSANFSPSAGTITMNNGGSIANSGSLTFNNLTIAAGATVTSNGSFAVAGTFNLVDSASTFTPAATDVISGAGTLNGNGTVKVTRTAATADFSSQYTITNKTLTNLTVEYAGASAQTVSAITYGNLKINMAGQVASLAGGIIVTNNLNIAAGTLSAGTKSITVGGNWSNSDTFNAGTGTVIFNDNTKVTTISGSTAFNNLTSTTAGKQITFTAGTTQTISGALTLTGASGNLIVLRSSSSPTQCNINPQGTRNVSFVDVKDSNNTNATAISATSSTDSGHNTNWNFVTIDHFVITGSASETAGTSNQLTITAKDALNNTVTTYTGDQVLVFSGANNAPLGTVPTVTDKNGTPVNFGSNTTITFTNGVSSVGGLMVLYKAETANVVATQGSVTTPSPLSVTVSPAAANYLEITGSATQIAGATQSLTIKAHDQFGNLNSSGANNYTGDKSLTFSGANNAPSGDVPTVTNKLGSAVNFGTATTIAFTNGIATAGGSMVLYKAESATINVSDGTINSTGHSLAVTVSPAIVNYLEITGSATQTAGNAQSLTIKAYDQFGNLNSSGANNYTGDKSLTFSGTNNAPAGNVPTVTNKTGAAVNFGTATTITFANGIATAGGSMVLFKAESATINVSDGTINSTGHNLTVTVSPTAANYLEITGNAGQIAGAAQSLTIKAYDAFGNLNSSGANNYTGNKSLTFSGANVIGAFNPTVTNKTGAAVNFGTATTITFTNGVATAGGSMVLYKVESATINASDGTINSTGHSLSVTVSPAAAATFTIAGSGSQAAGASNQLTITAFDQFGNTATGYAGDKVLVFSGANPLGSLNPTVTDKNGIAVNFGSNTTITFANGVSSAGGLMVLYKQETANIAATQGAVTTPTPLSVVVGPAAFSYLVITGNAIQTAGASNSSTITAYDTLGNIATNYTGVKSLTFSGLGNAPAGNVPTVGGINLGSAVNVTFTAGVSNVDAANLIAYKAENATLNVSDGAINSNSGHGLSLTVNPAAAAKLVFGQQPSNANFDTAISPVVTVKVFDQFDNLRSADNSTNITIAIGANPSSGTISGTTTNAASSGIAAFNNLSINQPGNSYTLTASSSGLTDAASNTFNITGAIPVPTPTAGGSTVTQDHQLTSSLINWANPPSLQDLSKFVINSFIPMGPVYLYHPLTPAEISVFEEIGAKKGRPNIFLY